MYKWERHNKMYSSGLYFQKIETWGPSSNVIFAVYVSYKQLYQWQLMDYFKGFLNHNVKIMKIKFAGKT